MTKDFQITDFLGNVRTLLSFDISSSSFSVSSFDYKPFGDTLWTTSGNENRLGYIGRERDYENKYFALGVRNYDSETGRFLSVDPIFEAFSFHTPYQYAYNSPIQFKDPSGLAQEDEKKDKLQFSLIENFDVELMERINYTEGGVEDEWNLWYEIETALGMYGSYTWFSNSPAESPWSSQARLNYACWGRYGYSFGNGAWRPNLSVLLPNKKGFYDGMPPLARSSNPRPRLGTIGGSGLYDNGSGSNSGTKETSSLWGTINSTAFSLADNLPIWGWCQKASVSFNDGDYVGWVFNWSMAFVDGFSFGYGSLLLKVESKSAQLSTNMFFNKGIGVESYLFGKAAKQGGFGAASAGLLNDNQYIRIGWSWWSSSRGSGYYVFRISISNYKGHPHLDLFNYPQIPWRP